MAEQKIDRTKDLDITTLTYVLFMINSVLEGDRWKDITFNEVYDHLDSGDLVTFLEDRLQTDLSIVRADQRRGQLLLAALRHVAGWFKERERRKMGIKQSGVCLVIGWIGEIIQGGQWKIDRSYFDDVPENIVDLPRS